MTMFKQFLNEMAMQWGNNLALFAQDKILCLYQISSELRPAVRKANYEEFNKHIYAVMTTRNNEKYKAMEVEGIWSRHGYGPFMYLIAMSVAGNQGLIPTRVQQLSLEAREVWRQFYEGAGRDLVEPIPLEDAMQHKEPYLNYKYVIKTPLNIQQMIKKGDITFRSDSNLRFAFADMAEALLDQEMGKVYGD